MSMKIFVGYTTSTLPDEMLKDLMPEFEGRKGTTDAEKIAQQIKDKQEQWKDEAANQPYTGTFGTVHLLIPDKKVATTYRAEGRYPFGDKPSVSSQLRATLLKHFPKAWPNEANYRGEHVAIFVGFGMRRFLKMLGTECSLTKDKLPLAMWYGNSEHRDIQEAVMPKEFKSLGWKTVFARRREAVEDKDKYDKLVAGWDGPGTNPERDAMIAMVLASQLGFQSEGK